MKIPPEDRFMLAEQRRVRLLELMSQHRLSCRDVARMLDRQPQTVRCWRAGRFPVTDHTLALLELILMTRRAA